MKFGYYVYVRGLLKIVNIKCLLFNQDLKGYNTKFYELQYLYLNLF